MMYKIGEVFTLIRNGANIKQGEDDTGYPITRIETISNRVVDRNKMGYAGIHEIGRYSDYILEDGDILMSHINSETHLGKVALYEEIPGETIIHGMNLLCLRPNRSILNCRYAFYSLMSDGFLRQIPRIMKKSVNQASFTVTALKELQIHVPPMEQQLQIVSVMDRIQSLLLQRQKQAAVIDQIVKSRFIELFGNPETNPKGWTRQRLDQICENLDSRRVPITSTDRKAGNYPYYGASGIVDYVEGYIFDEDILLISEDGANLVMRSTPIAFSVSGKVWVNNHAHVVRFETKATQKYIEICFALTDISGSITGTAQPKLNQAKLNAMMFCVPPIELQEQFAAFVEQTDKSKYYSSLSFRYCQAAANTYRQEWMTCRTSDF